MAATRAKKLLLINSELAAWIKRPFTVDALPVVKVGAMLWEHDRVAGCVWACYPT